MRWLAARRHGPLHADDASAGPGNLELEPRGLRAGGLPRRRRRVPRRRGRGDRRRGAAAAAEAAHAAEQRGDLAGEPLTDFEARGVFFSPSRAHCFKQGTWKRRQERKKQEKDSSLDSMMAYVDEYGNITTTPPDPNQKKKEVCSPETLELID
mgnify:CR=1 FL=1